MGKDTDIVFYESQKIGKGLPFVIVGNEQLMANNDLFVPSLRDFHVIFWCKKGKGNYFIDFKEYTMKENSIVLISKDHLHYFLPFEDTCELQSIVFEPNFIYRNDSDLKHLFNFNANCHYDGIQIIQLEKPDVAFLSNISDQLFEVYQNWEGKQQSEAFYHLLCLFLLRCEALQKAMEAPTTLGENAKILMEFNELLEQNFKSESRVDFYLDQLGITVKSLSRIIKEQYKVSTKAVIDERRILEIKRQLRGTTHPVKQIAYEMGFEEPTNMVKYFKKRTGYTPLEFRTQR